MRNLTNQIKPHLINYFNNSIVTLTAFSVSLGADTLSDTSPNSHNIIWSDPPFNWYHSNSLTNVEVALDFLPSFLTPSNCSSISNRGDQPQVANRRPGHHAESGRKVWNSSLSPTESLNQRSRPRKAIERFLTPTEQQYLPKVTASGPEGWVHEFNRFHCGMPLICGVPQENNY